MVTQPVDRARLARWQTTSFVFGAAGAALCFWGAMSSREAFFQSYLFGYLFWFGMGIGCLGILLLHHLVGGAWGDLIRPLLDAGAMTLPWLAVLFVPLLFGLPVLYPWARPAAVAADPLLRHKQPYLNVPFFEIRALLFFGFWCFAAYRLNQCSDLRTPEASERARRRSAPALVLYLFTITFALLDWMMSLEPHWYSTIYGAMVMIGQVLGALALMICGLAVFGGSHPARDVSPKPYLDLGNLLLAFVMFWAYMTFSQYLIMWSANIPEEIVWYMRRQQGGWFLVAMTLIAFQFFLPFLVLLGRRNKARLERLAGVAALIVGLRVLDTFWLIKPVFHPEGLSLHWLDAAALGTIGAIWIGAFLGRLRKKPAVIGFPIGETAS